MSFQLEKRDWDFYKDQLTGLDNHFALLEYIKLNSRLNIFVVNIDNFNNINSTYGYVVGDEILTEIAKYLTLLKPQNAQLFRFDGDEFVFIVNDFFNFRELKDFSESVISFFNQTEIELDHDNIIIKISVTIGVAMGNGIITLNHAAAAVHEARLYKKSSYKIFETKSGYAKKQQENIYWVNKIRSAIEDEKLLGFFQPIRNNKTKKIEKYECLARINDGNNLASPIRFMEACRITGTLSLVTRRIVANAFKVFHSTDYEFSINITSNDINLGYLEEFLMLHVQKYNIDPSRVVLELLEDIVTLTESNMLEQIRSLRKRGFKIALDDFGMENSNFSRLLELHPDYLKIDGIFIKDILENEKSLLIVETIVEFCKKSGIKVIAEYVHNEATLQKIEELGIDYSQGYFIGEPKEILSNSQ
ncbi:EAL domain-containing protein [Sulfurimonas paralvinellae]|uniref:Bifunctional diguanylate cyclase/phosphodiesterase n=1 Tax=Sulfurimonas paralvinellae TaxID=317658 RepID=A0A7M1B8H9_9BACT|nr:bifunctional diguanylate cyclase/phosphodiesterase [Sulfurimonas paralvinellae]QOP46039.1 bifunctional diguanylate cyclase/phosphodiesterase [Sulfurimonas paralvinellae]